MSYEELGKQFVSHYYSTLGSCKENLRALYRDDSIMTFEGTACNGKENIFNKIMGLTFKSIQHKITSLDCQPLMSMNVNQPSQDVVVMVMGQLKTDDDPPHSFSQTFILRNAGGGYFISNEMFRMILHD